MARYIMVAGEANQYMKKMFNPFPDIEIANTFNTVRSLTEDIMVNGVSFLQLVKSVVIIDYGFQSKTTEQRVNEFIELQDIMRSNSLQGTKLYLVTKDSDLYVHIRDSKGGIPGIHYINTKVMLLEGNYAPKIMGDILRGKRDKIGLYHPDVDKEKLSNRLIDDRDAFIEDSRTVSKDILKYGTDLPVSELSKTDFMDSPAIAEKVNAEEKEREKEQRRRERKKRLSSKEVKVNRGDEETPVKLSNVSGTVLKPIREVQDRGDGFTGLGNEVKSVPNLRRLRKGFERLKGDNTFDEGKVLSDRGIISFMGMRRSGVSGMVANVADTYASAGKTVLVIDLDIQQRSQTLYFGNYRTAVSEHMGVGNGLIKVAKGGTINKTAVQITSRVSVLGIGKEEDVEDGWEQEIAMELPNILEDARDMYDIVLVDMPLWGVDSYLEILMEGVDKNIIVVENKWYDIDHLFSYILRKELEENQDRTLNLLKKSSLVLNQYVSGRLDDKGEEVNRTTVNRYILKQGFPYDYVTVLGEIPYYEDWEIQYHSNTRYIWEDKLAVGVYRYLVNKVVW